MKKLGNIKAGLKKGVAWTEEKDSSFNKCYN